jgi:bifunctional non-homologous end joining protein LigD
MSFVIQTGRRGVEIPRPEKPLFPSGITKRDLASYYEQVADVMLPHLARRPLNLERYPDGIDGHRIIQQHASAHFPSWIRRIEVPSQKGPVQHVAAGDAGSLVYLAGQACITFHRWLSRGDRLDHPDLMVVDLDPSTDDPNRVRHAALIFGTLLRELDLTPWPMSTGSRGYHVVVALQRRADFDTVRQFALELAELAVARESGLFTIEQRKAKRQNKILVDILRNAYGHTSVSPYAVRPRPNAPVAAPLHWEELEDQQMRADRWTLESMPRRLERDGDPWSDMAKGAQTLTRARRRLEEARLEAGVGR